MKKDHPAYDRSMWKGAPRENFARAQQLRANMTADEKLLWERLKQNQLGYRFRWQHPVQKFIVDFYCHELRLVIEVDGGYHQNHEQKKSDAEREKLLEFQDLTIMRFTNEEVTNDIEEVINTIKTKIEGLKS
ncbi:endonuclease domain-containing protein [Autumnicola psychrophila]|uniref:Endonuclease domain-containing protein n=1 Tax=Autumnicola psychrophila TaxID=3075592 RepID=A0ABU3DNI3_9FLAO|nr:endonuclease domain-containing protein [Zunongwangia sp. F225]MDT0685271.1 endonuclease domain-containing protein [Zunongwangia sp. F225]